MFELQIVEGLIFALLEDHAKLRVVNDLFDFLDVVLIVAISNLKAQFEILIVKHSNVGLRIILKDFDYS